MSAIEMTAGGVTAAKGFFAAAAAAKIKYQGRTDMAMIYSKAPCTAAGTFTSNVVKASPVLWDRDIVKNGGSVQAVVVNSGIANACTGREGLSMCAAEAEEAAGVLGIGEKQVLLGSTGVIGMPIPMDRVKAGIEELASEIGTGKGNAFSPREEAAGADAGTAAARAIMTTDTIAKECACTFRLSDGTKITMGGMSKGSGMIHPNMCTMLCFITTDAAISGECLDLAVHRAVNYSFNMISVDGDTSTNDTCVVMANGLAGNREITGDGEDFQTFSEALRMLTERLAKTMAGDGEGASKIIEMRVLHADTEENAKILAKSVVCSSLTKAAIFGRDANWGRILCALGYSGVSFDPDKVDLYFIGTGDGSSKSDNKADYLPDEAMISGPCGSFDGDEKNPGYRKMLIFSNGRAADYSEEEATALLSGKAVTIAADMHEGNAEAAAWGCDLTYDYVKINADYRS